MAISGDVVALSISTPSSPDARSAFRAEVARTLAAPAPAAIVVDLDGLATLDSPAIAELIRALRAARERAVPLSLRVGRADHRETLRLTGLDRIFAIEAPGCARAESAVPKRRRPARRRRVVAAVAAILLVGSFSSGAPRASAGDPGGSVRAGLPSGR